MKKVEKDTEVAAMKTAARAEAAAKEAPKTVKKAAEETAEAPKTVKKAATTKTAKEAAPKAVATAEAEKTEIKKAPAKKAPARKTAVKETVYLQYLGKEINQADLMQQVKDIWTKQLKNKEADLKSIALYLKPEENMVYYVINDDVTGSIAL